MEVWPPMDFSVAEKRKLLVELLTYCVEHSKVREIVDPAKIVLIGCDRLATCREHFHH